MWKSWPNLDVCRTFMFCRLCFYWSRESASPRTVVDARVYHAPHLCLWCSFLGAAGNLMCGETCRHEWVSGLRPVWKDVVIKGLPVQVQGFVLQEHLKHEICKWRFRKVTKMFIWNVVPLTSVSLVFHFLAFAAHILRGFKPKYPNRSSF